MALGAALVVITSTETIIAGNFRNSRQAFYAAEAAAELAVAELRDAHELDRSRRRYRTIAVHRRRAGGVRALPTDAPVDLTAIVNIANCNAPAPCGGAPRWQLFAYGPLRDLAPPGASDSPFYIVAFVSGGQTESGAPLVTIRARPSVRAGPTRPSKSPSPERTPAKPSSCGPSSVDKRLAADGPSKTVTRGRRRFERAISIAPDRWAYHFNLAPSAPGSIRGPRAVQAIPLS